MMAGHEEPSRQRDHNDLRHQITELISLQQSLMLAREDLLIHRSKMIASAQDVQKQRALTQDAEAQWLKAVSEATFQMSSEPSANVHSAYNKVREQRDRLGALETEHIESESRLRSSEWSFTAQESQFYQFRLGQLLETLQLMAKERQDLIPKDATLEALGPKPAMNASLLPYHDRVMRPSWSDTPGISAVTPMNVLPAERPPPPPIPASLLGRIVSGAPPPPPPPPPSTSKRRPADVSPTPDNLLRPPSLAHRDISPTIMTLRTEPIDDTISPGTSTSLLPLVLEKAEQSNAQVLSYPLPSQATTIRDSLSTHAGPLDLNASLERCDSVDPLKQLDQATADLNDKRRMFKQAKDELATYMDKHYSQRDEHNRESLSSWEHFDDVGKLLLDMSDIEVKVNHLKFDIVRSDIWEDCVLQHKRVEGFDAPHETRADTMEADQAKEEIPGVGMLRLRLLTWLRDTRPFKYLESLEQDADRGLPVLLRQSSTGSVIDDRCKGERAYQAAVSEDLKSYSIVEMPENAVTQDPEASYSDESSSYCTPTEADVLTGPKLALTSASEVTEEQKPSLPLSSYFGSGFNRPQSSAKHSSIKIAGEQMPPDPPGALNVMDPGRATSVTIHADDAKPPSTIFPGRRKSDQSSSTFRKNRVQRFSWVHALWHMAPRLWQRQRRRRASE